jgi:tetratricopeptide (TPR) repeat protein
MKWFAAWFFAAVLAIMTPAQGLTAQTGANQPQKIETLFKELKKARTASSAGRIAQSIWKQWADSGSPTIDLLMQWSDDAMKKRKYDAALDFLDQVVTLEPDYAEGWNRRATVHYMMDEYAKSMSDIEHVLRLEPRHFGALTGMAMILKQTGRKELALQAYQRVLEVYPMMRSAQSAVTELSEELAGEGI